MEYRRLGNTDLNISRIGFGCWPIGGHGYGVVPENVAIRAIHKAMDEGINFFDTADVYGFGTSETILSKALGKKREEIVIATKFGVNWNDKGNTFKDSSKKRVFEAVEGSLKRLNIERIPIYQIHWHDDKTPIEETLDALEVCKKQGKIQHIGVSNFDYNLVKKSLAHTEIVSNQIPYNILDRTNEEDIVRYNNEMSIGVLVYRVLGRGLFSGKYDLNSEFGKNDTRSDIDSEEYKKAIKLSLDLKQIAEKYDKTISQVAIRWVLDNENITSVLVGIKSEEQAIENAGACGWKIPHLSSLSAGRQAGLDPGSIKE